MIDKLVTVVWALWLVTVLTFFVVLIWWSIVFLRS